MARLLYLIPVAVVALIGLFGSLFVVTETQKALVLQFGQIRQVVEEPGLGFKIPLIQEVVYYDDRILSLDTETIEVTPSDDRRLVVDAFARYRIADVVAFRQAVGLGGIPLAEDRLSSILNAEIREVLGADQVTSDTILSQDRRGLMNRIRDQAALEATSLGVELVDVRLKMTNLPSQNLEATFARMRAERDSQITRGEADAEANRIFAEAYGADPEFFDFYRSMQAYQRSLQGDNSTLVMTPDSDFFTYLYSGDAPEPAPVPAP
jgi:modulator of FtsH protease HflC